MFIVFSPVDVEVVFSDQLTVFSKKRSAISLQLSVKASFSAGSSHIPRLAASIWRR
jgi:hypothetical protein